MSARCNVFFVVSLCLATTGFSDEPRGLQSPQVIPQSAVEKTGEVSILEHLRVATEQLETAGMAEEAASLRAAADQIHRRAAGERAELARQIAELQNRSAQLERLTGLPGKILCRCCFVELPASAAVEFEAAAGLVSSLSDSRNSAPLNIRVYQDAEESIQQLKQLGKVTILASPQLVTAPGRRATSTSGGEFPVVIPVGEDRTSVEWCRFGTECNVLPRVLETGRIRLEFQAEIVERDFKNSVTVNGLTIPGLSTRMVNTLAEMNLGETLVASFVSNPQSHNEDSLEQCLKYEVRWANAELDTAPPEKTVTLFMVTPVAFD